MADLPRLIDDDTDAILVKRIGSIPEPCRDGLLDYIRHGIRPGSFLLAVLENNLYSAVARADDDNRRVLPDYVLFLYHHAPADAWGSPLAVKNWIARGVKARAAADEAAQALGRAVQKTGGAK